MLKHIKLYTFLVSAFLLRLPNIMHAQVNQSESTKNTSSTFAAVHRNTTYEKDTISKENIAIHSNTKLNRPHSGGR